MINHQSITLQSWEDAVEGLQLVELGGCQVLVALASKRGSEDQGNDGGPRKAAHKLWEYKSVP